MTSSASRPQESSIVHVQPSGQKAVWLWRLRFTLLMLLAAIGAGCGKTDVGIDPTKNPKTNEPGGGAAVQAEPPVPASIIRFEDIAEQSGVRFIPTNGREAGRYTIVESLGTGVAVADLDRDDRLDIIAPGGGTFDKDGNPVGQRNGVFRQNDLLQFENIATGCGIDTGSAYTHGVAIGDWNNDGFVDVVITGFHAVRLFQNCGDGTFQDVTPEAELSQAEWATSAAFFDADNDGDLELYIVNYVEWQPDDDRRCMINGHRNVCPPARFDAVSDRLYDNLGDGSFHDVSQERGLEEGGKGLAVIAGDVDLDGDSDLYIANDTTANFLYLNQGDGRFVESALVSGCALGPTLQAEGSMGVAFSDFDLDGLPDIWVSNYENQSFAMYQSRAPGIFQHVSAVTGISAVGQLYVGFGTAALDADLDGDQDIFAGNGHVMYESARAPLRQEALLFENLAGQQFRNVIRESGEYGRSVHMARGVTPADLNQDGSMDLVVAHMNEPIAILKNTSRPQKHWVSLALVGRRSNRSAIGARAKVGTVVKLCTGGGSYLSDTDTPFTWAIDSASRRVEVEIVWPSGNRQSEKILSNRINTVVEHLATSPDPS